MKKSFTFFESIFIENDKLMLMINIFLILRILLEHKLNLKNSYKSSNTDFEFPQVRGILKKNEPSKPSPSPIFLPLAPSFFRKPSLPLQTKSQGTNTRSASVLSMKKEWYT